MSLSTAAYAQTPQQNRAKAYYLAAEKAMAKEDYAGALEKLSVTEETLGHPNARTLGLRVKILVAQEKYVDAKRALEQFFEYPSTDALLSEMSEYLVEIDDHIAEERAQSAKAERERREAAERHAAAVARASESVFRNVAELKIIGQIIQDSIAAREQAARINEDTNPEARSQAELWGWSWRDLSPESVNLLSESQRSLCGVEFKPKSRKYKRCVQKVDEVSAWALTVAYATKPHLDTGLEYSEKVLQLVEQVKDNCRTLVGSYFHDQARQACKVHFPRWDAPADELMVVLQVAPVYPRRAISRGIEGAVIVEFTVSPHGNVVNPVVVESASSLLNDAALGAARKMKYKPKLEDGVPVAVHGERYRFNFKLER